MEAIGNYIVIDETHRAGADSYLRIMEYFNPKFLLGMTATPERTDGADIFKWVEMETATDRVTDFHRSEGDSLDFYRYFVKQ